MIRRRLIGVSAVALAAITAAAGAGLAAKDPRGIDDGNVEVLRPNSPIWNPKPTASIPSGSSVLPHGNPLWGIPLSSLSATRERPLFSPSRRPPAPVVTTPRAEPPVVKAAPPPAEPETPQLSLLGVVTGGGDGYAVLLSSVTHDIVRLRTGEGYNGWVLRSVNGREVVLEKNHQTAVVALPVAAGDQK